MKSRKGAGYLIEGIVSIMVLLIFVAGSYSTMNDSYDWVGFGQKTSADDITYTLKKTEHIDSFVERGETGAIRGVSSSLLNQRLSVAGAVNGLPTGDYLIGVYVDQDGTDTVVDSSLQDATDGTAGDRCVGDLEEIKPDEGTIMRTDSGGSLESRHGIRLYFADADPGESGTDDIDYDSVWVDNRSTCQFTRDEGPYRLNDFVSLDGTIYKFNSIESPGTPGQTVFQNSELSYEVNKDLNQMNSADVEIRRFNFSSNLDEYDLLIFKDRDNLGDINSYESELLNYLENGKAVLAMSIQESDLQSGFLSETGLRWVDLNLDTVSGDEMFGDSDRAQKSRSYLNQLGFTTEDVSIDPEGKVSSGTEHYTRDDQILGSTRRIYDRSAWDASNTSMETESQQLPGIPDSDCSNPYRNGSFVFPDDVSGTEELHAYNVKLSGAGCGSFQYGVAVDKTGDGNGNPDGDMDDKGEGVYLTNGVLEVNERLYQVKINSHTNVNFDYIGDERAELFSYRNDLETQSAEGFGRFPSLTGSSSQERIATFSALTFMMLDDEKSFGSEEVSSLTSATAGKTSDGDVFSVNLRWIQ